MLCKLSLDGNDLLIHILTATGKLLLTLKESSAASGAQQTVHNSQEGGMKTGRTQKEETVPRWGAEE